MKVDRSLLPPWKYCPYHGKKVRSCEHLDNLESDNYLIISNIVDELGIPKTEKQVEKMVKRLSKELKKTLSNKGDAS